MAFPPKQKTQQPQQANKPAARNQTRQSQDMEQYWRTGKKPTGYQEDTTDDVPSDSDGPMPADDPSIVYAGPEQGPFECSNCVYFIGDGQPCQKVSDPVQAEGCCNKFESAGHGGDEDAANDAAQGGDGASMQGSRPSNAAF